VSQREVRFSSMPGAMNGGLAGLTQSGLQHACAKCAQGSRSSRTECGLHFRADFGHDRLQSPDHIVRRVPQAATMRRP